MSNPAEPSDQRRGHGAENNDRGRENVQLYALIPKRRNKPGTKLQPNGKDEEQQPKLLHEMKCVLINGSPKWPTRIPAKSTPGSAEADAAELQTSERHPEHTDKGKRADGVGDRSRLVEFEEPAHAY